MKNDCGKDFDSFTPLAPLPADAVTTMAYVPFQQEKSEVYSADQGYSQGTMYPALNKPFYVGMCGGKDD